MTFNWEIALSASALAAHIVSLVIWSTLRSKMEKWIWWVVVLGFFFMASHRISEVANFDPFHFGPITAVGIALAALSGVVQTWRFLKKRTKEQIALTQLRTRLENLAEEVKNREPIATQIAEIITDLRSQICYYEKQAEDHHLPLFPK